MTVPSLSFSTPGSRKKLLDGRKTCTTRPMRDGKRFDQFRHNPEVMNFWKSRMKGRDPLAGRLFNSPKKHVQQIRLFNPRGEANPAYLHHKGTLWVVDDILWIDKWVKAEGFRAIEDLYEVLRGYYDYDTPRGLWYTVWWQYPPPADQPADSVWTPEMIP